MMDKPVLKVKLLHPKAKVPCYAHPGDAGLDLFTPEKITIKRGEQVIADTGVALELPEGTAGLIWDKSSIGAKHGIKILGGVFDQGYRGPYAFGLINLSKKDYTFDAGDKIAQVLIQPIIQVEVKVVDKLSKTSRGDGCLGSTGK